MLVELRQPTSARDELGTACAEIASLFERLATKGATETSVLEGWPYRRPNTTTLRQALALPDGDRAALRDAVHADLEFAERFDDPTFRFRFATLEDDVKSAGKALLVSMYDDVFRRGKGFSSGPGGGVNRSSWEEDFRSANPEVGLCPACLISELEEPVDDTSLIDADHYLPKSIYPPLAVHGLNLVPMCKGCNQALKASKDPLSPAGQPLTLDSVWFPYRRAGLTEIELSFAPARRSSRQIGFAGEAAACERGERFDRIFRIIARWNSMLTSIHRDMVMELDELLAVSDDRESVRAGLDRLIRLEEKRKTRNSRAFVKTQFYAWMRDDLTALDALVTQIGQLRSS